MDTTGLVGIQRALAVSMIAFTIVFVVLAGLTCLIYAIKVFAGGEKKNPSDGGGGSVRPAASAIPVALPAAGTDKARLTAIITAAVLAATHGCGRIVSISPVSNVAFSSTRNWRTMGIMESVSARLSRSWK